MALKSCNGRRQQQDEESGRIVSQFWRVSHCPKESGLIFVTITKYLFLNDTLLENHCIVHCTYGSAVYSSNIGNIVRKMTVNSELENSRCAHFT
jgi:hypothetical protein